MTGPTERSADVVVLGATAGGVAAAVAAARNGASVTLLEPGADVGGMLTGGLSRTDVERQESLIGGIAAEVFERIGAHYGRPGPTWRTEPHVATAVLESMLDEAGVRVVRGWSLDEAVLVGRRLWSLHGTDGTTVDGHAFVDATYEGDLLAASGASFAIGREDRSLHGEAWAGRQELLPNPHQVRVPVSALDDDGRLLPGVQPYDALAPVGAGDGRFQAYCYRICLSRSEARRPLAAPPDYDRSRYRLVERYVAGLVAAGIRPTMHDVIGLSELPGDKADVNSHGPFSTDLLGGAWDYPLGDAMTRARIRADHRGWAEGLLHFLAHDPGMPAAVQDLFDGYGYPTDEFTATDGWPHQLYVREARRLQGGHVLTERDLLAGHAPGDTVAMGGYNIDIREVQWVAAPVSRFPDVLPEVMVEGYRSVPVPPYGIPYRALLPRRSEVEGLLVPVCLSSSSVAFGSLRMEPQYLVAGQAAGTAAALAARHGITPHDVDVDELRQRLRAAGQVLTPR